MPLFRITPQTKKSPKVSAPANLKKYVGLPKDEAGVLKSTATMWHFQNFWTFMDTLSIHAYVSAAMGVIGRSALSSWFSVVENMESFTIPRQKDRKRLQRFYGNSFRDYRNIKDFFGMGYNLYIAVAYLRYFGRCAFYIIRNNEGVPIGLDFLHGFVVPNVDSFGFFRPGEPAFVQFPTRNWTDRVEFKDPNDIVYVVNPDWEGFPGGGSDMAALAGFNLPMDLYLQQASKNYLENRDRPESIFELPPDISDEGFDEFAELIDQKYRGSGSVGKSPIVVAGEVNIKELSPLPDKLPYIETRKDSRQEQLAVAGVHENKLGVSNGSAADIKETRREFHETTMLPLFRLIEEAFNHQIHRRIFNIEGWNFQFNSPDFLTAVEQATVHMRYRQMGVLSPNEVRNELGYGNRENGDTYIEDKQETENPIPEPQGSPPEGREERPDAPSEIGEPTDDDQDPVRGDQHDDTSVRSITEELLAWKKFVLGRLKKGQSIRSMRKFIPTHIPTDMYSDVTLFLEQLTPEQVPVLFDVLIEEVAGELH